MKLSLTSLLLLSALLFVSGLPAQTTVPAANVEEIPEGVIEGLPIERGDGRWLGLTMEGPKLRLNFYDEKKHPEKPDRPRAVLRLDPVSRSMERDVMNPSADGVALVSNKPIRAPWIFKAYITLIDAGETADPVIVVDFNRNEVGAATKE